MSSFIDSILTIAMATIAFFVAVVAGITVSLASKDAEISIPRVAERLIRRAAKKIPEN